METHVSGLDHLVGMDDPVQTNFVVQTTLPKREDVKYEVRLYCGTENSKRTCLKAVPFKNSQDAHHKALRAHFSLVEDVSRGRIPKDEEIARYFQSQ